MTRHFTLRERRFGSQFEPSADWDRLLARSDADPLFCSGDWLSAWWRHHGADFGLAGFVLEAYAGERLVGLAPFFSRRVRLLPAIRAERVELLGNLWRTNDTVMSERMSFVVDREFPTAYESLAGAVLARDGWAEIVVAHTEDTGPTFRALTGCAKSRGLYQRRTDAMAAYAVDLSAGFEPFLKGLSSKTRRRVFNERKKLAGYGEVSWETAGLNQLDEYFASLDMLHEMRWGWRASAGRRGRMYREVAEHWGRRGGLSLGRLQVGGRTIAATFDLRVGDCLYGIQKAVDTSFSRAVSPGFLLTGYSCEAACAEGVRRVDFLGGEGKTTDYKSKIGAEQTQLACLQVVQHPLLATAHRISDAVGRERLARVRGVSAR